MEFSNSNKRKQTESDDSMIESDENMEFPNKRRQMESDDSMVEADNNIIIPTHLLVCPECDQNPIQNATRHPDIPSTLWLTCSNTLCCACWGVCQQCNLQRTHFLDIHASKKHSANCHKGDQCLANTAAHVAANSSSSTFGGAVAHSMETLKCFGRQESVDYFKHQLKGGVGHKFLVGQSQFPKESTTDIDGEEADVILRISRHCFGLSRGQRSELVCIFAKMERVFMKQFEEQLQAKVTGQRDNPWPVEFPKTMASMRSLVTEGSSSVIKNLPHPEVLMLKNHSVVSLLDVVAHHLASGFDTEEIGGHPQEGHVEHTGQSPKSIEIRDNALKRFGSLDDALVICLREWSDDFDSNNTKDNRAKTIWVKTVTIGAPPDQSNCRHHTHVVAIGKKGDCHEEAEALFKKDLLALSSGEPLQFFSKKAGRSLKIHAELFVSLQDQPERRDANFMTRGTGTHAARWSFAANLFDVSALVPSCSDCLMNRLESTLNATENCDKCANWDTNTQSGILDFDPPKKYPESEIPESKKLSPKALSYEKMTAALHKTHEKIKSGKWF